MSLIDAALADLRITGAVLLHERYAPGTAIAVPDERKLRQLLGHGPRVKVAPFHLVLRGGFELATANRISHALSAHDVAICLEGSAHQLRFGRAKTPISLEDVLSGRARLPTAQADGDTELICGVFAMQSLPLNPLVAALPNVLRCQTGSNDAAPLLAMARTMLELELATPSRAGDAFTRARLLEIFFAEAIRAYHASTTAPLGWFRGLGDAKISAALTTFHRAPSEDWTVERLAASAALSPSRFAARFRDALGLTAMEYVARWRIHLTCRLLEDSENTLDAIADKVGYGGGAALSKAFKDRIGCSPAKWRAQVATSDAPSA